MDEVTAMAPRMALKMAERAGVAPDSLLEGMPFDRHSLARRRRIDWDDYCTLVERLEVAVGGPDALYALLEQSYHEALPPAGQAVMRRLVSPRLLYRTMRLATASSWARVLDENIADLSDDRIQVVVSLRPGFRGCRAFFHGSVAGYSGIMGYIGRPPATVDVLEVTDRSMNFVLHLPRVEKHLASAVPSSLRKVARALRELTRLAFGAPEDSSFEEEAEDPAEHALTRHVALEPLGQAVVALVASLGWHRVVLHVSMFDRADPMVLCACGTGAVSTDEVVTLRSPHRLIGLLELGGTGDRARLDALLTRITICLDAACTLSMSERLASRTVIARLRPRERETLAYLVRGLSEKEVAAALSLSPNTVHHYIRGLYRAFGVTTRTELLARFLATDVPS